MSEDTATFRDFADIIRCRPSYVTELKKSGRLVLTDDKKRVRVAESVALIEATRDPSRRGVAARHEAARAAALAPPSAVDEIDGEDDADDGAERPESPYHSHRAEREKWQAASAKRDYELSIGKLMVAEEVEAAVANIGTMLRQAFERLPDVLAPQLAPVTDEARVHSILQSEIEQALRNAARQLTAIGKSAT